MVFFSIFFAMLVSDAGYGLVFLLLNIAMARLVKQVPRQVIRLMYVMSGACIVWGVLTGGYFGLDEALTPFKGLQLPWLTDQDKDNHMMSLCFFLGASHLTIAHLWRGGRLWPSLQTLAQVGWICTTWVMFFLASSLVLGHKAPAFTPYLFGLGIALIVAFMTPFSKLKTHWFDHVVFPLDLINNFVDVVSYLRLFAVGAATYAVAEAFNAMAFGLGLSGPLAGLAAALILFFGHGLNLLLACAGVLVHGVRLNTLEFANHLGVSWAGHAFDPLRKTAQTDPDERQTANTSRR